MTTGANLPLLTDEEVALLFSGDSDGARRYRVLRAVLVHHRTQREAAQEEGVSERTVRNVLRVFGRSGSVDALRTRATAARRKSGRMAAAEEALAMAAAEEPLAGGDRLWRRAQELLGPDATLSRRTAYRLLAQLRARVRHSAPLELASAVRAALPLLPEDPPLTLGGSALAQRLLIDEPDALSRGTLLRQALREAIARLRPAGEPSGLDRAWWPFLICTGEYEQGGGRLELQTSLVLSASTYSRAKRQALDKIVASLPSIVAQLRTPAAAIALQRLPRTPDFVGRHEEERYYAWRLQTEGLARIWGLPGSGKTVLAAELAADAHRHGRRVLWHTCHAGPDATLAGTMRGLAEGLDEALLRDARALLGGQGDEAALLDELESRIADAGALVVLDDVQRAGAALTPLISRLTALAARGVAQVLLVGRARPEAGEWPELPGLDQSEAPRLWGDASALGADQWQSLYVMASGLPQPLRLAAAVCHRAGEQARLSDAAAAVEAWAQDAIWGELTSAERRVLAVAQVLAARGVLAPPAAICWVLGVSGATVLSLRARGLLTSEGVRELPVLQHGAALALREEAELRAAVERMLADEPIPTAVAASNVDVQEPETIEPPATLELLARVRRALLHSTRYLQLQRDAEATRLARELAQLQALLPEPRAPRRRALPGRRAEVRRIRVGAR